MSIGRWLGTAVVLAMAIAAAMVLARGALSSGSAPTPTMFAAGLAYPAALEQAKAQGKAVLVVASATWCGPCQAYKRDGLQDRAANQFAAERLVPVYLDVDADRASADALGVSSIPLTVIVRDGQVVARQLGVMSGAELRPFMQAAVEGGG